MCVWEGALYVESEIAAHTQGHTARDDVEIEQKEKYGEEKITSKYVCSISTQDGWSTFMHGNIHSQPHMNMFFFS